MDLVCLCAACKLANRGGETTAWIGLSLGFRRPLSLRGNGGGRGGECRREGSACLATDGIRTFTQAKE